MKSTKVDRELSDAVFVIVNRLGVNKEILLVKGNVRWQDLGPLKLTRIA